jgi:serine/threonine protein kinase
MRATNDKLVERYIVVIARELAKALTGLHAAGILHRDIKGMFSLKWLMLKAQNADKLL